MTSNQAVLANEIKELKNGSVTTPKGFFAGGLHCGLKRRKLDLGWLGSNVPATAAAVYTTNIFQAAPLHVTKESMARGAKIQGILVNSGNANACTGKLGLDNAYKMQQLFAEKLQVDPELIAIASTGVIGEQLPMNIVESGIESIELSESNNVSTNFEQAIMTTDTFTKHACVQLEIDGKTVTIGGAAKGSGMIHPNMATMLGFVTTDAAVEDAALYTALKQAIDTTFNMITVDGDTSTNDMVLVMANGLAENHPLNETHPQWSSFVQALVTICQSLAKQMARDGEGATKLIEVKVKGAATAYDAQVISKAIVGSSLVKSAVFGADANWGRVVCAMGYSGASFNPDKATVKFGDLTIFKDGLKENYDEAFATQYLTDNQTIHITIELEEGNAEATAWGCDLTYDYVKINAAYRT